MLKLVVRRLLSAIAVLFVVSLITFVVLLCIPGDPAQLILGVEATPEKVEALRASMGLDRPWYCLLYTSPSPRDPKTSRMPSSA